MNNQQIADIASKYHASTGSDMNDGKWRPFVDVVNAESAKNGIQGTPTVFVDGDQYTSNDFSTFLKERSKLRRSNLFDGTATGNLRVRLPGFSIHGDEYEGWVSSIQRWCSKG